MKIVYRLIVGSQLELLLAANSGAPPDAAKAVEIYNTAKTNFPNVYENFSYDTWLHYPMSMGFLKFQQVGTSQILRITPLG